MSDSNLESRYIDVLGSPMHYVEAGEGHPILFLHGNPTSSFIWRNIIPKLSGLGHCIAPDLIGMGRSAKPNSDYRFFDHVKYVEEFVHALKLRNVTIVGHDWGGAIGFYYAMHHERNVRAVAFFETIVRPLTWNNFDSSFRVGFQLFRIPLIGQLLIQGLNLFVTQVLPRGTAFGMDDEVLEVYARPFQNFGSRKPIWRMPNDLPIGGRPSDVHEAAEAWSQWLRRSQTPKLLLHGTPGALIQSEDVAWCRANIKNLDTVNVGPGVHYLQEDQPTAIAEAIDKWMKEEIISPAEVSR